MLVFKSVQQRSQSSFLRSRFFKNGKVAKLTLTDIGKNINMDLEISEENTGLVIIALFDISCLKQKNVTSN